MGEVESEFNTEGTEKTKRDPSPAKNAGSG